MLSRTQAMENLFLENFLPKKLKANADALMEDRNLLNRSILTSFEEMHFNFFILNIRSLNAHSIDLANDIYATKSDHICLVETHIYPEHEYEPKFLNRKFEHASIVGSPVGEPIPAIWMPRTLYHR